MAAVQHAAAVPAQRGVPAVGTQAEVSVSDSYCHLLGGTEMLSLLLCPHLPFRAWCRGASLTVMMNLVQGFLLVTFVSNCFLETLQFCHLGEHPYVLHMGLS